MTKILFADDDDLLREYVANFLDKNNNNENIVDMASTASQAIEMIKKNSYDKAVIDLRFNNESIDGFKILKVAKEKGIKERIVFTSVSHQMDLVEAGATAGFRKPLSMKKIAKFLLTNDYELLKEGEIF